MDREIWQRLLSLESRDITQQWYSRIHGRQLNARRSKEINSAAKQSREFFRNASYSDNSVRPLLTFYGVATLSRALFLLLRRDGGEEGVSPGHGLSTVDWGQQLSRAGDISGGLSSVLDLKVETCSGLFTDLVSGTDNRMCVHVRSAEVDWRLCYETPQKGVQISLRDLFSRIPDLRKDYCQISDDIKHASVGDITYNDGRFYSTVGSDDFRNFKETYERAGYTVGFRNNLSTLESGTETFEKTPPLFVQTYIQKTFRMIPGLYIAEPFPGAVAYSQLCITYLVGYFLGMLVRYFPTHWVSLCQGDKGDRIWPTINRAQHFVEQSFPELVIEMIYDVLNEKKAQPEEENSNRECEG